MDGRIFGSFFLPDRFDDCMDIFLRLNAGRDCGHTYQKAALELILLGNRLRRWREAYKGQVRASTTPQDGHDGMVAFDGILRTLEKSLSTDATSYQLTVSRDDLASVTDVIWDMMRVKLDKRPGLRSIWRLHDSSVRVEVFRIMSCIATLENLSPGLALEMKRLAEGELKELNNAAVTKSLDIFPYFRRLLMDEIDPWLQEAIALRERPMIPNISPPVSGSVIPSGQREHGSMIEMSVSDAALRESQQPLQSDPHTIAIRQSNSGARAVMNSSPEITAPDLDAMVRKQVSSSGHTITCSLACEFRSCLDEDLSGVVDLGDFLVITGTALRAYATTCKEWIAQNWGSVGWSVLGAASEVLQQRDFESPELSIHMYSGNADGDFLKAAISHPDVDDIVKMVQTLVWLTVTLRPLAHGGLNYSSASASLNDGCLNVSLKKLAPVKPWAAQPCWHTIVGNSIIAGGFYTKAGSYGLELPFPLMLELTSMIYKTDNSKLFTGEEEQICAPSNEAPPAHLSEDVSPTSSFESSGNCDGPHRSEYDDHVARSSGGQVQSTAVAGSNVPDLEYPLFERTEDLTTGIFFTGVHSILYPTERDNGRGMLKWHYEASSNVMTPPTNSPWLQLHEADLVGKKTLLGYTPEVQVNLGTSSRLKQYDEMKSSCAQKEKSAWNFSLDGITLQGGFAGSGIALPFRFARRKGQQIAPTAKATYEQIVDQTVEKPVILFDTACDLETAWLVSQLSVILDLALLQASRKKSWQGLRDEVRADLHAKPHWDGGRAAASVLENYETANTALYQSVEDDKPFAIKDLVTQIFAAMSCRTQIDRQHPSKSIISTPPLLGWDLLDLTNVVGFIDRLQVDFHKKFAFDSIPTWLPLAQELPVYFCDNLGTVMESKASSCVSLQRGKKYLVASMSSLRSKLKNCARCSDWHINVKGNLVWKVSGNRAFSYCNDDRRGESEARPQFEEVVQQMVPADHKYGSPRFNQNVMPSMGAFIFGSKRPDAPKAKHRDEMHEVAT